MRGHEFRAELNAEFARLGTAGRPIVFIAEGGARYTVLDVVTVEDETQVLLLEEGK